MPKTISPCDGRFSDSEVCQILGIEDWILRELVERRALQPQQNGLFSEFDVARARTKQDVLIFISKLRKSKTEILALRKERESRTPEAKRKARHEKILAPSREDELRSEIDELKSMVKELIGERKPAHSGVVAEDEE